MSQAHRIGDSSEHSTAIWLRQPTQAELAYFRTRGRLDAAADLDRFLDQWLPSNPRQSGSGLELPTLLQVFLGTDEGRHFAEQYGLGQHGPESFRLDIWRWQSGHADAQDTADAGNGNGAHDGYPAGTQRCAIRLGTNALWFVFDQRTAWNSRVAPGRPAQGRVQAARRRLSA